MFTQTLQNDQNTRTVLEWDPGSGDFTIRDVNETRVRANKTLATGRWRSPNDSSALPANLPHREHVIRILEEERRAVPVLYSVTLTANAAPCDRRGETATGVPIMLQVSASDPKAALGRVTAALQKLLDGQNEQR